MNKHTAGAFLLLAFLVITPSTIYAQSVSCIRAKNITNPVRAAVFTNGIFSTSDTLCVRKAGDINADGKMDYRVAKGTKSVIVTSGTGRTFTIKSTSANPTTPSTTKSPTVSANLNPITILDPNSAEVRAEIARQVGVATGSIKFLQSIGDMNYDDKDDYHYRIDACSQDEELCAGNGTSILMVSRTNSYQVARRDTGVILKLLPGWSTGGSKRTVRIVSPDHQIIEATELQSVCSATIYSWDSKQGVFVNTSADPDKNYCDTE